MAACAICQHPKVEAIHEALGRNRAVGLVAHQFRVDKRGLVQHLLHTPRDFASPKVDEADPTPMRAPAGSRPPPFAQPSLAGEDAVVVLKSVLPTIRQAARLAGDDRQLQERMIALLNEALAGEDMGL